MNLGELRGTDLCDIEVIVPEQPKRRWYGQRSKPDKPFIRARCAACGDVSKDFSDYTFLNFIIYWWWNHVCEQAEKRASL